MLIQLKCSCGDGNCPEWAVVELQGIVEAQSSFQDCLPNLQIGVLCRPSSEESYTFTVGYHELIGTKVSLKKPILVLKKIKLQNEEEEGEGDVNSGKVELDVIGVIRHKILFKTRPKALISGPASGKTGNEQQNGGRRQSGSSANNSKLKDYFTKDQPLQSGSEVVAEKNIGMPENNGLEQERERE